MTSNRKVAIVTGGSSGIGRATALALAKEGVKVVVVAARGAKEGEEIRPSKRRLDVKEQL
jgi:NAD(P)-dependent dehydrogenase (short-subunit alcohol dehydrogenase family)